jgi:RNA polymerase sigma factor (TIGR02999 family)
MTGSADAPGAAAGEITLLLRQAEAGDAGAGQRILPLVYAELRRLAASKMAREKPGHTLQPTALVHEAWLRIGGDQQPAWRSRAQFFSAAAEAMRRILIENARRKRAVRHGGAVEQLSADSAGFELVAPAPDEELLTLNEALDAFAQHDARKAELVKQWYFVGLTLAEAAEILDISERTAKRDLAYAKAWLYQEIKRLNAR